MAIINPKKKSDEKSKEKKAAVKAAERKASKKPPGGFPLSERNLENDKFCFAYRQLKKTGNNGIILVKDEYLTKSR